MTNDSSRSHSPAHIGDRDRLLIPVHGSVEPMLLWYTRRARVLIGIEVLVDHDPVPLLDVPALDLTGLAPPAAMSRLVAFDSRFEWVDAVGIFNVRPKPEHAVGRSILEQRIETFSVTGVTAEVALDAIAPLLGTVSSGAGYGEGGLVDIDEDEQRRRIRDERAKTFSMTLANSSLREILNAVCRSHGTVSWSLRPHGKPDRRFHSITFDSYNGWSVSKWFRVG